ncbi:MAG: C40 family peptidase [Treponema sp.]|nr:C40 family peptidase [Treponema sp.]
MKKILFLLGVIFTTSSFMLTASAQIPGDTRTPQELRYALISEGKKYIGTPYAYGGLGPNAFDCSGFIYTVAHDSIGYQLPRTSKALYSYVTIIPRNELQQGDIVFFRTRGSSSIAHAGIYIGNGQFIHAASDGPNTGVIVSSLSENYWGGMYAGAGKFLPVIDAQNDTPSKAVTTKQEKANKKNKNTPEKTSTSKKNTHSSSDSFFNQLVLDGTVAVDWSLFTSKQFMLNFRSVPITANLRHSGWPLQLGIGSTVRFNTASNCIQIPIFISATPNDYLRVYAGPVITAGSPELPGDDRRIEGSVFPGIIGVSWQTPSFTKGDIKVTLAQDISYTIFNETDGGALSVHNSLSAGLLFSTGVRIALPFSMF